MKTNSECLRAIMLQLEEHLDPGEVMQLSDIIKLPTISNFSPKIVEYSLQQLKSNSFIEADIDFYPMASSYSYCVDKITNSGLMFCDMIRDDSIWEQVKPKLQKVASIDMIESILSNAIDENLEKAEQPKVVNNYNIGNAVGSAIGSDKANINFMDTSTTYTVINNEQNAKLMNNLRDCAKDLENETEIITSIDEMQNSIGKKTFLEKYQNFIACVANHITIFAPFIPALTDLLNKTAV